MAQKKPPKQDTITQYMLAGKPADDIRWLTCTPTGTIYAVQSWLNVLRGRIGTPNMDLIGSVSRIFPVHVAGATYADDDVFFCVVMYDATTLCKYTVRPDAPCEVSESYTTPETYTFCTPISPDHVVALAGKRIRLFSMSDAKPHATSRYKNGTPKLVLPVVSSHYDPDANYKMAAWCAATRTLHVCSRRGGAIYLHRFTPKLTRTVTSQIDVGERVYSMTPSHDGRWIALVLINTPSERYDAVCVGVACVRVFADRYELGKVYRRADQIVRAMDMYIAGFSGDMLIVADPSRCVAYDAVTGASRFMCTGCDLRCTGAAASNGHVLVIYGVKALLHDEYISLFKQAALAMVLCHRRRHGRDGLPQELWEVISYEWLNDNTRCLEL